MDGTVLVMERSVHGEWLAEQNGENGHEGGDTTATRVAG
jgi:hypothetical protein